MEVGNKKRERGEFPSRLGCNFQTEGSRRDPNICMCTLHKESPQIQLNVECLETQARTFPYTLVHVTQGVPTDTIECRVPRDIG